MTDIKFARDYGYHPAAPFWLVWNEDGRTPMFKHPSRDAAEAEAARLAASAPGCSFHVLSVMSTITTSIDIVGQRFDPAKSPPVAIEPECEPVPAFIETEVLAASDDDGVAF
ncbi:hypothetical protein [Novosphingobium colocasiae]|uniref:hypothetical protein n=1 Tax=Novosphingobium colocasiae TaxID=1256513 RepID=UPI0035AF20FA